MEEKMQTAYQTTDKTGNQLGKYDFKTTTEKDSKESYNAKKGIGRNGIDNLVKDTPKSGLEKKKDIYSPLLDNGINLGEDEQKLYKALLAFAVLHSYISQEMTRMYGGVSELSMGQDQLFNGYNQLPKKNTPLGKMYGKQGEDHKMYGANKSYDVKSKEGYAPQTTSAKVEYKN